jgi:hypothetical protein
MLQIDVNGLALFLTGFAILITIVSVLYLRDGNGAVVNLYFACIGFIVACLSLSSAIILFVFNRLRH